jgi:hypothetical protein
MIHLYSNFTYHDPAYLCGTKESLIELREAINLALREGKAEFEAFTADGEGYELNVYCLNDDGMSNLQLPYTDPSYTHDPQSLHPSVFDGDD